MEVETGMMSSTRPYLLRALYEWITDNGLTPHILLDAAAAGLALPGQHVVDGKLVLNIGPDAVRGLHIDNEVLRCSARFGGVATPLQIPVQCVQAVYARENGKGIVFSAEEDGPGTPGDDGDPRPGRPRLRVVE